MNSFDYSLSTVEQTVFDSDYVKKVETDVPIFHPELLKEIHTDIRRKHDGLLVYPELALIQATGDDIQPNNEKYSIGWHVHSCDALNISQGSDIPSFLTKNSDAVRAIHAATAEYIDALSALGGDRSMYVTWAGMHPEIEAEGTLHALMAEIQEAARVYLSNDGEEGVTQEFERCTQICRHMVNQLLDSMNPRMIDTARNYIEAVQQNVPEEKRLALYPNIYAAYSIPARQAHCRSILHGALERTPEMMNRVMWVFR